MDPRPQPSPIVEVAVDFGIVLQFTHIAVHHCFDAGLVKSGCWQLCAGVSDADADMMLEITLTLLTALSELEDTQTLNFDSVPWLLAVLNTRSFRRTNDKGNERRRCCDAIKRARTDDNSHV